MKEIRILKESSNQRVDKFIKKYLNTAPLSFIYKLFRKKDIKVNGHWVKENYILNENDELKIYITDALLEEFNKPINIENINHNLDIVYEDDNILILNKPKGILVQGDAEEKKITLTNFVRSYLFKKSEFKNDGIDYNPSPVHRLDRNTSGICIFAKKFDVSQVLMDLFKNHEQIEKYYLALVVGCPKNKKGTINAPLLKNEDKKIVKVSSIEKGAKTAITEYEVISTNGNLSLLKVKLLTGRTHQIRVHLAYIGCPIVGDPKYGDFIFNRKFNEMYKFDMQFLHSYKFKFKDIPEPLKYLSMKEFEAKLSKKECDILNKESIEYN